MTFWWTSKLIFLGLKQKIKEPDLFELQDEEKLINQMS
jgi:hypothetical protein